MTASPKNLALIAMLASSACIGAGCIGISLLAMAVAGLVTALVWLAAYRWPQEWLITIALFFSVAAGAAGLLFGANALGMIGGAALALVAWDLALFDLALADSSSRPATASLEKSHFVTLGLVFVLGLLVAAAGRLINLQIPFIGILLLVALVVFALERAWRGFSGRS